MKLSRSAVWVAVYTVPIVVFGVLSIDYQPQTALGKHGERIDYGEADVALLTLQDLRNYTTEEAVTYAAEALEGRPALLEEAGNVLVVQGRRWQQRTRRERGNPVVERVGMTVQAAHLDSAVRAKAVWVLGELGTREALDVLGRTYAGDSRRVGDEVQIARQKLGVESLARRLEMLGWGHFLSVYTHGDSTADPRTLPAQKRFAVLD